jgi:ArsR family transcriptional regulator
MKEVPPLEKIPDKEILEKIANLFKAFADPTRVQILSNLVEGELCVTDITQALGLTQSAVSHQLSILKQMDLVKARREGKSCFYSLADDHVLTILQMGLEHVLE